MPDSEQDARIALLQEYGSNARNWYNVFLALAIVLFTVVQVRNLLEPYVMCVYGFRLSLWGASLALIASQAVFVALMAVANSNAAKSVVRIKIPEHFDAGKTYLAILYGLVERGWRPRLGSWYGWILWTLATGLGSCFLLARVVGLLFSCGY